MDPEYIPTDEIDLDAIYSCLSEEEQTIVCMLDDGETPEGVARCLGINMEVVWRAIDRITQLELRWKQVRVLVESV